MKYYLFECRGTIVQKFAMSSEAISEYFGLSWSLLVSGRVAETKAPLIFANNRLHEIAMVLNFVSAGLTFRVVQKWTRVCVTQA